MTPQQPSTAGASELAKRIAYGMCRRDDAKSVDSHLQPLRDAVEKRIAHMHSIGCGVFPLWERGNCTCGHDALLAAAALLRVPGSAGEGTATRKERKQ